MESQSELIIKKREEIIRAVSWRSEQEQPEFGDIQYKAFVELMTYRREIARKLISEWGEKKITELESMFEDCNDKIRKILGL